MASRIAEAEPNKWAGSETDRLAILEQYDLDADGFGALDQITDFAAALCETAIALVSIVEEHRQFFMAATGLAETETPRSLSFCAHAMLGRTIMVVPDTQLDPRFVKNGLVTGPPYIRFYAGAPLVSADGVPLGSLCVIDDKPHAELSPLQREGLEMMARQVVERLESRRRAKANRAGQTLSARALLESEQRFRVLADTMPQMVWSTSADGLADYYNARWYEFTGVRTGQTDGDAWNEILHPDDRQRASETWQHSLDTGEAYEIEYRLRHRAGGYRWVLVRALPVRDENGVVIRWFGTCTDIHEQKTHLEERELIAHELSHRIKNIFSVISGLIGFSARGRPEMADIAEELRERVMALGRAHDYVRPHSSRSASRRGQSSLTGMLEELFAPYRLNDASRVSVTGTDLEIDDRSATPLALFFHELATNAAKYGALSVPEGHVVVDVAPNDDMCTVQWREQGGPMVKSEGAGGFGSHLMELSIERQLGGTITRKWLPDGLEVTIAIPIDAMRRE